CRNMAGGGMFMGLMDTLKSLGNLVKEIGDIELNRKIIDLQQEVYQLIEENHELKNKLEELKRIDEIANKLTVKGHFYVMEGKEGLFCTACWDNNRKLIRVHVSDPYGVDIGNCPICNFSS